ncbi:hypothetical protein [Streptomyces mobaraensis]|uniref:hypothetical protein n=1 Tax=Streptomyces mobaraensis TaxID=35621 RepID=UPI0033E0A8A9
MSIAAEAAPLEPRKPASPRGLRVAGEEEPDDSTQLGRQTRNDRCLAGQLLNWGEVETKAVASGLLDGPEGKLGSDGKYHLKEGDRNSKIDNPNDLGDTITDIDVIDGGVLWEEKTAVHPNIDPVSWAGKTVGKKLSVYIRARQYIKGYEKAPIGMWFVKSGTTPELRRQVELRLNEFRALHPDVDIRLRWTD